MKRKFLILVLTFSTVCLYSQKKHPVLTDSKRETLEAAYDWGDLSGNFDRDTSKASKQKTMNWIQEKLTLYIKDEYTEYREKPFYNPNDLFPNDRLITNTKIISKNVYFKDDNLIIELKKHIVNDNGKVFENDDNYIIPISNLSNFEFNSKSDDINFTTFDNKINNNNRYQNYAYFKFESGKETKIARRLRWAFVHLVKFYYKSTSAEPF